MGDVIALPRPARPVVPSYRATTLAEEADEYRALLSLSGCGNADELTTWVAANAHPLRKEI